MSAAMLETEPKPINSSDVLFQALNAERDVSQRQYDKLLAIANEAVEKFGLMREQRDYWRNRAQGQAERADRAEQALDKLKERK